LLRGHNPHNVKGHHCLVNWQNCLRPKKMGGIGIKDLDKFSRALWLRWLWYGWDHRERPWKHLLKVTDKTNKHIFFSSIVISTGDGKNTPFGRQGGCMWLLQKTKLQIFSRWQDSRIERYIVSSIIIIGLGTSRISIPPHSWRSLPCCSCLFHLGCLPIKRMKYSGNGQGMTFTLSPWFMSARS
jgi:hypothetical protein